RVIQEHIKKPLAEEVLFGKLKKGGTVKVTVGNKPEGATGLLLESIPDEVPVKPKREAAPKRQAPKKPAARKAKPKAASATRPKDSGSGETKKRSLVPQLPRKS